MRGRRRAMAAAVAAIAVVAAGAVFLLARDSGDEPDWTSAPGSVLSGGSCQVSELDLGFARLPAVREPVFDLGAKHWPRVRLGGDGRIVRVGEDYVVTLQDETRHRVTRNWRIEAWIRALDERGHAEEEVSRERMRGPNERGAIPAMDMDIGEEPGFYRLDLRIADAGRYSGRYGMYIKAVPPHGEGRLVLAGREFRAGESVEMRVENLGSEPISYGTPVTVQRRLGDDWSPVPGEHLFTMIGLGVAGGEAGECLSFELPQTLSPGRHRFVKEVSTRKEPRGYHDHILTAEFTVVD